MTPSVRAITTVGIALLAANFILTVNGEDVEGWKKIRFGMSRNEVRTAYQGCQENETNETYVKLINPEKGVSSVVCHFTETEECWYIRVLTESTDIQSIAKDLSTTLGDYSVYKWPERKTPEYSWHKDKQKIEYPGIWVTAETLEDRWGVRPEISGRVQITFEDMRRAKSRAIPGWGKLTFGMKKEAALKDFSKSKPFNDERFVTILHPADGVSYVFCCFDENEECESITVYLETKDLETVVDRLRAKYGFTGTPSNDPANATYRWQNEGKRLMAHQWMPKVNIRITNTSIGSLTERPTRPYIADEDTPGWERIRIGMTQNEINSIYKNGNNRFGAKNVADYYLQNADNDGVDHVTCWFNNLGECHTIEIDENSATTYEEASAKLKGKYGEPLVDPEWNFQGSTISANLGEVTGVTLEPQESHQEDKEDTKDKKAERENQANAGWEDIRLGTTKKQIALTHPEMQHAFQGAEYNIDINPPQNGVDIVLCSFNEEQRCNRIRLIYERAYDTGTIMADLRARYGLPLEEKERSNNNPARSWQKGAFFITAKIQGGIGRGGVELYYSVEKQTDTAKPKDQDPNKPPL